MTVVDVVGGDLLRKQTVLVVGNRIQSVGPTDSVRVPAGTKVIDARTKYLMPGLWDMHAHVYDMSVLYRIFIARGITGIRMMGNFAPGLDTIRAARPEIAAGRRIGPRLIGTGPRLFGAKAQTDGVNDWTVATPEAGRRAVDSLKAAGADFVKVYSDLDRDIFYAIAAQARKVGIPLVGHHQARAATEIEASDSGQRSIEHFGYGTRCDAVSDGAALPDECRGTVEQHHPCLTWSEPGPNVSDEQCRAAAERLRRNNTWLTPTLVATSSMDSAAGRVVRRLHRYGMPMLAGSDGNSVVCYLLTGCSIHKELALLVAVGGLSPLEALRTATINPARYLQATDSLGSIAPGKVADLVLLDGDPLGDIWNTMTIRGVVANGRYFDRAALDALSAATEAEVTALERRWTP